MTSPIDKNNQVLKHSLNFSFAFFFPFGMIVSLLLKPFLSLGAKITLYKIKGKTHAQAIVSIMHY